MSTSESERSRALRARAFNFLPGSDFEDALTEAREYHRAHPVDGLIETPNPNLLRNREVQHLMVETHQQTLQKLAQEHCEAVMMPFLRKDVPYSLAKEIVEEMVLVE